MENFREIIEGQEPVLVDFFATWCGPCKMMHPVMEELSRELKGKARILKVDIDKNSAVANKYQIQAVPTFIFFKGGEVKWRGSGVLDKQTLLNKMQSLIE